VLTGKVYAPEGTIPIAGALVYSTYTSPPDIPDGVYCDKCVKLTDGTPFTTTAADGSFKLSTFSGDQLLVVQKGAFRRVRSFKAAVGDNAVPKALTTMPPKIDKAKGDDVPKMAVALARGTRSNSCSLVWALRRRLPRADRAYCARSLERRDRVCHLWLARPRRDQPVP